MARAARALLQSFHGALCAEQRITAPRASRDSLFTFSRGESWQPQCVWACQYEPRPQLTRICVSLHNKTFPFFSLLQRLSLSIYMKKGYHSIKSEVKHISRLPLGGTALTLIHLVPLHQRLHLVNDIRAQTFKSSIPLRVRHLDIQTAV